MVDNKEGDIDKNINNINNPIEESNTITDNTNKDSLPEGESISSLVNQVTAKQLQEMGYSKNVSEKALFLNQGILEKSIEWIYENQNEPDFEEELRMVGQKKVQLSEEEIKQKAKELQAYARQKYLQKEKERAEEQEKMRIRMTKELAHAKKDLDDAETKRFIEQQKRKKLEEEREKKEMLEQLARDKEERFGKKFAINGEVKKEVTPFEDAKYYCDAIVKLYPTFRCGDQAKTCLNTIKVLLRNIINNPTEEKFRKIKMTNPNIQERVGKIPFALKLLSVLGFKEEGEFYELASTETELLKKTVEVIESEINKIK